MEQETKPTGEGSQEAAETGAQKLERDLRAEIQRLSASFLEVMRVAWQSDQRKQLERDLKTGLNAVATNLEAGFKKVSESEEAREFLDRAEDVAESVAEKVRRSEVAQDLGEGLLKGLRSLSERIDQLATELKRKEQGGAPGATAAGSPDQEQEIPIDKA
jgi:uncharacterized protein with von Willebrand factor type A (vWA) domain